jgi:hypothetical protein
VGSSSHTALTGVLDQSALYGVLAEVQALGLNLLEVRHHTRNANHHCQVTAVHLPGGVSEHVVHP